VPYSQRYLFNAIPDTNYNANPNRNSKGDPNATNPNTRYRCEYGTINSMFAVHIKVGIGQRTANSRNCHAQRP